jgi:hypothetical protein
VNSASLNYPAVNAGDGHDRFVGQSGKSAYGHNWLEWSVVHFAR